MAETYHINKVWSASPAPSMLLFFPKPSNPSNSLIRSARRHKKPTLTPSKRDDYIFFIKCFQTPNLWFWMRYFAEVLENSFEDQQLLYWMDFIANLKQICPLAPSNKTNLHLDPQLKPRLDPHLFILHRRSWECVAATINCYQALPAKFQNQWKWFIVFFLLLFFTMHLKRHYHYISDLLYQKDTKSCLDAIYVFLQTLQPNSDSVSDSDNNKTPRDENNENNDDCLVTLAIQVALPICNHESVFNNYCPIPFDQLGDINGISNNTNNMVKPAQDVCELSISVNGYDYARGFMEYIELENTLGSFFLLAQKYNLLDTNVYKAIMFHLTLPLVATCVEKQLWRHAMLYLQFWITTPVSQHAQLLSQVQQCTCKAHHEVKCQISQISSLNVSPKAALSTEVKLCAFLLHECLTGKSGATDATGANSNLNSQSNNSQSNLKHPNSVLLTPAIQDHPLVFKLFWEVMLTMDYAHMFCLACCSHAVSNLQQWKYFLMKTDDTHIHPDHYHYHLPKQELTEKLTQTLRNQLPFHTYQHTRRNLIAQGWNLKPNQELHNLVYSTYSASLASSASSASLEIIKHDTLCECRYQKVCRQVCRILVDLYRWFHGLSPATEFTMSMIFECCYTGLRSTCFQCRAQLYRRLRCGRCFAVVYCSKTCQIEHWEKHRLMCETFRQRHKLRLKYNKNYNAEASQCPNHDNP